MSPHPAINLLWRRRVFIGCALGAILMLNVGCEGLQKKQTRGEIEPWPTQTGWEEFPEFKGDNLASGKPKEKKGFFSFLQNDRQAAGLSSEARDIERRFGYR